MDKMTVERLLELQTEALDHLKAYAYKSTPERDKQTEPYLRAAQERLAVIDLALLALSPPQDVAGLIEDLRGAEWICDDERLPFSKEVCRKAADALTALSVEQARSEKREHDFQKVLDDELTALRKEMQARIDDALDERNLARGDQERADKRIAELEAGLDRLSTVVKEKAPEIYIKDPALHLVVVTVLSRAASTGGKHE